MASIMIHLAIAECLIRKLGIREENRFLVGQILPDAVVHADKKASGTHYDTLICNASKKIMDFNTFYHQYQAKIHSDAYHKCS